MLIPSNGTQQVTLKTSFSLPSAKLLGKLTAPAFTPDGAGGGTFVVTLPSGVTDGLLQIEDLGPAAQKYNNCYTNGSYPAYFTIHVTGSGTYTLPDKDGVGSPTVKNPTICTAAENLAANPGASPVPGGDTYTVQLIGADYPPYSSNYFFNLTSPKPAILGAGGSDDITISPVLAGTST